MATYEPAATAIRGSWWRQTPAGTDPWFLPAVPADNRWQRGDIVAAMYLADSRDTAWAEWYRVLAERRQPPLVALPREMWRWNVDLTRVADLCSGAALAALGLGSPSPTSDEWPGFQRVGEALHHAGWTALVAPSAARPSGRVLCVFRAIPRPPGVRPCPPPERIDVPPAPPRGMTT